jgi:hypothetical protein
MLEYRYERKGTETPFAPDEIWGDFSAGFGGCWFRRKNFTVFSFQIAQRSAQLEPAKLVPELGVLLDSFPDLVASKMVALVERGAPRDFRDIHAVCQAGLITPQKCWDLWRRRQRIADSDTDHHRATLAVETHLERIAQHRPLDEITDPEKRREAHILREWFREVFLNAAEK